jgi:hypothetical protein
MADDCAATSEHATANEMGVVEVEGTEWKGGFFCIMDGPDLQPKAAATADQGRFCRLHVWYGSVQRGFIDTVG